MTKRKGSEQLTWTLLGGAKPCSVCGRKLRIADVREHGVDASGGFVVCVDCWPGFRRPA